MSTITCKACDPNGEHAPHAAHVEIWQAGDEIGRGPQTGSWVPSCADRVLDWWNTDGIEAMNERKQAGAPEASNQITVYGAEAHVIDVDLGYADLGDPDEFAEWVDTQLSQITALPAGHPAAKVIGDLVNDITEAHGHIQRLRKGNA